MKKVGRILFMSAIVSFSLIFTLIMLNAIMGIFISFDFCLLLFGILTIGFTLGLILFDSKRIFTKKKVKKPIKRNTARNVKQVDSRTKVRKKIS
ncbi:hypothetical protein [Romboutsia sp. 13368]|uniref:hypothetical protein n=1 Tax=Romboutsia sp. 13368 TaxID=2708053 RepID=UPI0025D9F654|nr:hypothetical protein [Romboutsia sp. 13368]